MKRFTDKSLPTDERLALLREAQRRDEWRIREDTTRTNEWRQAKLQESYEWHTARHYEILAEDKARREQRKAALERKLFSPKSGNHASFRQVVQQASQANSEHELRALYDQAARTSDEDLLQGVVYVSSQRGFRGILADYAQSRPEVSGLLEEYSSPEVTPSEKEQFKRMLFRPAPKKPDELRTNIYDW